MPIFTPQVKQRQQRGTSINDLVNTLSALQMIGLRKREEQRDIAHKQSLAQKKAMENRLKAMDVASEKKYRTRQLEIDEAEEKRKSTEFLRKQKEREQAQEAVTGNLGLFGTLLSPQPIVSQEGFEGPLTPQAGREPFFQEAVQELYPLYGKDKAVTNLFDILEARSEEEADAAVPRRPTKAEYIKDPNSETGWSAYFPSTKERILDVKPPWEPTEQYKEKRKFTYGLQEKMEEIRQKNRLAVIESSQRLRNEIEQNKIADQGIDLTNSILNLMASPNREEYAEDIADSIEVLKRKYPRGYEHISRELDKSVGPIKRYWSDIKNAVFGETQFAPLTRDSDGKTQATPPRQKQFTPEEEAKISDIMKDFPGATREEVIQILNEGR